MSNKGLSQVMSRPKTWSMTPGQRFDPKGSSYSMLTVNQNPLNFFYFYTYVPLEFSPTNNIPKHYSKTTKLNNFHYSPKIKVHN